jgi:hypothetical protein
MHSVAIRAILSPEWETFRKRHLDNVAVYRPGQSDPTRGRHNHDSESVEFFKIFPDNHLVNTPYEILFGQGDYTCSVADFTGTMKGTMKGLRFIFRNFPGVLECRTINRPSFLFCFLPQRSYK